MTVTYSPNLDTDLSTVRFWLRDMVTGAGPLPGDANFADSELTQLITLEGSWQCAVAAGFEALVSAWSRHVTFSSGDLSISRSNIAATYAMQAAKWRAQYGNGVGVSAVSIGTIPTTRIDGFSDTDDDGDDTEYI